MNRVMTGPRAWVEDLAPHCAESDELLHDRLRSTDVPRCRSEKSMGDAVVAVYDIEPSGIRRRRHADEDRPGGGLKRLSSPYGLRRSDEPSLVRVYSTL